MEIKYTRAMLNAALDGKLDDVPYVQDPVFKVQVPTECPGVPNEVLLPQNTWQDKDAYLQKAKELASKFEENFKQYESYVSEAVKKAGPEV